jgi:hypothetical protein
MPRKVLPVCREEGGWTPQLLNTVSLACPGQSFSGKPEGYADAVTLTLAGVVTGQRELLITPPSV